MTRRRLSAEERALWKKVADQTERLHPALPEVLQPEKPAVKKTMPARKAAAVNGQRPAAPSAGAAHYGPALATHVAGAPVRVDRKLFRKMQRGKLAPEARLDLHGMTLAVAHPALTRFILGSAGSGKRLVLVITGKGREDATQDIIPERRGVLRRQVPQWLAMPPLAAHVLQVTPAHVSHGGAGAWYVYLRRPR